MDSIYLRKWISEAFTGVLGKNLILYAWDILILHRWSADIFFKVNWSCKCLISHTSRHKT